VTAKKGPEKKLYQFRDVHQKYHTYQSWLRVGMEELDEL
jgi:hypothetical protein